MSRSNTLILLFLATSSACLLPCAVSGQTARRDAQAVNIIRQSLAASGGAALLTTIQDVSATGSITYYWDPPASGSIAVKSRGLDQFRLDATLPNGVRTVIASKGTGWVMETDGTVLPIYRRAATNLGNIMFPYAALLRSIQDSSITILYGGLVNHLGKALQDVTIKSTYAKSADPDGVEASQSTRHFYIDPNTLLVSAVSDVVRRDADGDLLFHEVIFANYQNVNGILAPFWITESIGDQSLLTMQLDRVSFNTSLTDTAFEQ